MVAAAAAAFEVVIGNMMRAKPVPAVAAIGVEWDEWSFYLGALVGLYDRLVSHWLWQEDRVDAFTVINLKEPNRGQNTKLGNFKLPYFIMYDNLLTSLHFDEQ
ncbi:hypothetical protein AK812_SmicGene20011 [Symbiodinium microadriaticum]|uniref:Uncharacterized protein n=1 Tax=Symbiodinium microadriaticum TaxID=2951 RepID=A0A1Q9DR49_SYMMI|nr:hypothetical protein AK812_SmicGene20011 [Symbiodinium microadriaticum]